MYKLFTLYPSSKVVPMVIAGPLKGYEKWEINSFFCPQVHLWSTVIGSKIKQLPLSSVSLEFFVNKNLGGQSPGEILTDRHFAILRLYVRQISSNYFTVTMPQLSWDLGVYQPCQYHLSQATTPETNSGHHWQCMTGTKIRKMNFPISIYFI